MKEIIEFRICNEYAHLLLEPDEGKKNASNTIIYITRDDPKFEQIRFLRELIRKKKNDYFFLYSGINRKYSKKELDEAALLQMLIKTTFEPPGEMCGTVYDETVACKICGANRGQISPLSLKKGSVPKKDIAITIAGEVVVSEKFATAFKERELKGAVFEPVAFSKGASGYYQLTAFSELELTDNTLAGVNLFDFSEGSKPYKLIILDGHPVKIGNEVYKCPRGHTIGLNLLSEAYVLNSPSISSYDLFSSKQKIGVKRGLLRPNPIYFCSPAFRKMVEEENLKGFGFEIANIEVI